MQKNRFLMSCLLIGIAAPVAGVATVLATPRTAAAESCGCSTYCTFGADFCLWLVCNNDPQQACYGKAKDD